MVHSYFRTFLLTTGAYSTPKRAARAKEMVHSTLAKSSLQYTNAPRQQLTPILHVWVSTNPMGVLSVSTPPFLEDEDIFQKSASMVRILLQFRTVPWRPIFESHL
jgi:hypothetical protein